MTARKRWSPQLFETAWRIDRKAALSLEAKLQKKMFAVPNQAEAVAAALEQQPGNFANPA